MLYFKGKCPDCSASVDSDIKYPGMSIVFGFCAFCKKRVIIKDPKAVPEKEKQQQEAQQKKKEDVR